MENIIIPLDEVVQHKSDPELKGQVLAHAVFNNGVHAEIVYLILPDKEYRVKHQLPDMAFVGIWDIDLGDPCIELQKNTC